MSKKIVVQARPLTMPSNGFKSFTVHFLQTLTKRLPHMQFELLTMNHIKLSDFDFGDNVDLIVLPQLATEPEYLSTVMWENLQTYNYVVEHKDNILFYLSPYTSLPLPKLPVPEAVVIHDVDYWINRGKKWTPDRELGYELRKKSIYNADYIFTVSEFAKSEVMSFFRIPSEKITTIHEDINPLYKSLPHQTEQILQSRFHLEKNKFWLYIGSNEARKNLHFLLQAHAEYTATSTQKLPLVLVGNYNTRTANDKIFESFNSERVIILTEYLEINELVTLYDNANAFIYPSLYEGFGLQIVEAQNRTCPLVISDIPIFHEIAGDAALYFDISNSTKLAERLLELENNPELRKQLILKGLLNKAQFSWDKTVNTFLSPLQNLISQQC